MDNGSILITGGTKEQRQALVRTILLDTRDLGTHLLSLLGSHPEAIPLTNMTDEKLPANVDVLEIVGEEGSIKTETVRAAQSWLATNPIVRKEKIAVVFEAQELTPEAQNAFLKTLEEPPTHAFVILTAPESELLLPTVVSRCHEITLQSCTLTALPPEKVTEITELLEILSGTNLGSKWQQAAILAKSKESAITFLEELEWYLHTKLVELQRADSLMVQHIIALGTARRYLKQNCNSRLVIENLFLFW